MKLHRLNTILHLAQQFGASLESEVYFNDEDRVCRLPLHESDLTREELDMLEELFVYPDDLGRLSFFF